MYTVMLNIYFSDVRNFSSGMNLLLYGQVCSQPSDQRMDGSHAVDGGGRQMGDVHSQRYVFRV